LSRFYIFVIVCAIVLLSACEIVDPKPHIPAYISVENVGLTTLPEEGSATHNIADVWVYINEQTIGAFEVPVTFPVLYEGKVNLSMIAGIKLNGIASTRTVYTPYANVKQQIVLHKDSSIVINPTFNYQPEVTFELIEDFESPGFMFAPSVQNMAALSVINTPYNEKYGTGYARVLLNSTDSLFNYQSINSYNLPKTGKGVFVELDYKSNVVFTVSLMKNYSSYTVRHDILNINPKEEWNKIYVNLTNVAMQDPNVRTFSLVLSAIHNPSLTESRVELDNIKLLH